MAYALKSYDEVAEQFHEQGLSLTHSLALAEVARAVFASNIPYLEPYPEPEEIWARFSVMGTSFEAQIGKVY